MAFKVNLFQKSPDFEMLQAAKLSHFPLEPRDYKPYSQVRLCFSPAGLHLQMLSFEAHPLPASAMEAVLRFPLSKGDAVLSASLFAGGEYRVTLTQSAPGKNVAGESTPEYSAHPFSGEDLQGVYWGGMLNISLDKISTPFSMGIGQRFWGNFYKLCRDDTRPHYGSFYPADFTLPLFASENLGEFVVIDY